MSEVPFYAKIQQAMDAIVEDSTDSIVKRLADENIDVESCKDIIRAGIQDAAEKTQLVMALA